MSFGERVKMGIVDPIQGGAQLLTKMLPDSVVNAGNIANNWLADKTGLVARLPEGGVDQQTREREAAYNEQRSPEDGFDWARLLGNVVSPVNMAFGAAAPARIASLGGRMAAGAGAGAAAAAMAPVGSGDFMAEKAQQIGTGAAFGGAVPAIASGVGRVISPRASVNADVLALKGEGIRPTVGQTLGGVFNKAEEKAISLPIVGDSIAAARQRAAPARQRRP
jgi:hypothetical protein